MPEDASSGAIVYVPPAVAVTARPGASQPSRSLW